MLPAPMDGRTKNEWTIHNTCPDILLLLNELLRHDIFSGIDPHKIHTRSQAGYVQRLTALHTGYLRYDGAIYVNHVYIEIAAGLTVLNDHPVGSRIRRHAQ